MKRAATASAEEPNQKKLCPTKKRVFFVQSFSHSQNISAFADAYDIVIGNGVIPDDLSDFDALAWKGHSPVNQKIIDSLTRCKIIANHGAGYDQIDSVYAASKGIWVANTPDVVGPATADIAMAHLINITRRMSESERSLRETKTTHDGMFTYMGHSPQNKILGIVGMGSIGKQLAKRAVAFDMKVIYYCRNQLPKDVETQYSLEYSSFENLLKTSDYISINVPSTPQTFHLIGQEQFNLMKDGVYIINTARGEIIDEQALVDNLKSKKVAGAGLDVFEKEPYPLLTLFDFPNVSMTPHIGTATYETRRTMEDLVLENIDLVLKGSNPKSPVPQCQGVVPR